METGTKMKMYPNYLIIGNGKMAKHFRHYLSISNISFKSWSRTDQESLEKLTPDIDFAFLLIKDSEIESFYESSPRLHDLTCIHFSGAKTFEKIIGMHPLMTFGPGLYSERFYQKIPFIVEKGRIRFKDVFPILSNPIFEISPEEKALYHAKCVMASNFSVLLWNSFFDYMKNELKMGREDASLIMQATMNNIKELGSEALTGPLERGDLETINRNFSSLIKTGEANLYKQFVETYFNEFKDDLCLQ